MKENSVTDRHGRWWRFVPLIVWIGIILYSSTGNASMAKTSRFLRPLLEMLFSSEDAIHWANIIIRKIAHLAYYAILGGLAAFAFVGSPLDWLRKNWFWSSFGLILIIAAIDEINQSFDPSRIGSITDVLLDCVGGSVMLLIFYFLLKFRSKKA